MKIACLLTHLMLAIVLKEIIIQFILKKSLHSLHLGSGEISVLTSAGFYLFTKTLQLSRLYLAARFRGSLSVIHSEVFPY